MTEQPEKVVPTKEVTQVEHVGHATVTQHTTESVEPLPTAPSPAPADPDLTPVGGYPIVTGEPA